MEDFPLIILVLLLDFLIFCREQHGNKNEFFGNRVYLLWDYIYVNWVVGLVIPIETCLNLYSCSSWFEQLWIFSLFFFEGVCLPYALLFMGGIWYPVLIFRLLLISSASWASIRTELSWTDRKCRRYGSRCELCICWCWNHFLKWIRIGSFSASCVINLAFTYCLMRYQHHCPLVPLIQLLTKH